MNFNYGLHIKRGKGEETFYQFEMVPNNDSPFLEFFYFYFVEIIIQFKVKLE